MRAGNHNPKTRIHDPMKYQVFKGQDGTFYWRLLAANRTSIAVGGEGYKNKSDALDAIALVKGSASAPIEDLTV